MPGTGSWSDPATWAAGRVPTDADTVVIASGSVVELPARAVHAAARLEVLADGELRGGHDARLRIEHEVSNAGTFGTLVAYSGWALEVGGAVVNYGTLGTDRFETMELFLEGDAFNHGTWRAPVFAVGDRPRTLRLGDMIDWGVTVRGQVSLRGASELPQLVSFSDGGTLTVLPDAQLTLQPGTLLTILHESFNARFFNRGVVVTDLNETHPRAASFAPTFSGPASVRLSAYGSRAPATFAGAVQRWWRTEPVGDERLTRFERVVFRYTLADLAANPPELLQLFHSADGGQSWRNITAETSGRSNPEALSLFGFGEFIADDVPAYGDFALAVADPAVARGGLVARVGGRSQIRVGGAPNEYTVYYANTGSTTVHRGLLLIETTGGVYIDEVHASDPGATGQRRVLRQEDFAHNRDSTQALLVTPALAPREQRSVRLVLRAVPQDDESPARPLAAAALPAVAVAVAGGVATGYLVEVLGNAVEEFVADPCNDRDAIRRHLNTAFDRADEAFNPFGTSETPFLAVTENGASGLSRSVPLRQGFTALTVFNGLITVGTGLSRGLDRMEESGRSVYSSFECPGDPPRRQPPVDPFRHEWPLEPVRSWDPNQKVGPTGTGAGGHIATAERFTYRIDFENLPAATAPAWRVSIVDTLSEAFDPSTVRRIGESHEGFTFSRQGDVLTWVVEGIELVPNVDPPEGEGWVEFSVEARPGLPHGTRLENRATIVFDMNPPIHTNSHLNTLDLEPPVTRMQALPEVTEGEELTVRFDADDGDAGSGIESVAVYASRDGGPFEVLGVATSDQLTAPVEPGEYTLYGVARDRVGNVETSPTSTVTTRVQRAVGIGGEVASHFALHPTYPNPFNPSAVIRYETAASERVLIEVFNALGQRVAVLTDAVQPPGSYVISWTAAGAASGLYVVRMTAGGFTATQKAMLVR